MTMAIPGKGQNLYDRVLSCADDRVSRVQQAFHALGLPWTPEMSDAERVRHSVVHEGAIVRPGDRKWDRDRARVGTLNTMLTALLSKVIGYDGPIADRSKSAFNIMAEDQPPWWAAAALGPIEDHHCTAVGPLDVDGLR